MGISYGYHDSAVALLRDGHIVAAAQEERFTRIKQDSSFPIHALKFCLNEANISLNQVSHIFYYEHPVRKLGRILTTQLNFGMQSYRSFVHDLPSWLFNKVHVKRNIAKILRQSFQNITSLPKIQYIQHHESHAAAAFYASPFEHAVVLCVDGVGEWETTTAWVASGSTLKPLWNIRFPHSLGLLYSAMTYFCGFKVDSGEYKLMGLAPYGVPRYRQDILNHLIDVKEDGSFWLNMKFFDYAVGESMITDKFCDLFGGPPRQPEGLITQREFDLAASIQVVLEEILLKLCRTLKLQTKQVNLCMAGGVALNCVANGKLMEAQIFEHIWVQPAAGDSGGALGAALWGWYQNLNQPRVLLEPKDAMQESLLGSSYQDQDIEKFLSNYGAVYTMICPRIHGQLSN
jgi:carbamoyltransferase